MKLTINDRLTLKELVKVEIYKSMSRRDDMYSNADDNYSIDTYWQMKIEDLERILNKLT